MSSNSFSDNSVQSAELLRRGVAIGIAGGLAEVVVVSLYSAVAGTSVVDVATNVASAVHLDGTSAWTGLIVHMTLAVVLGIAITFVWNLVRGNSARVVPLYVSMLLMLAAVWAINFFIVLPLLSPSFVTLLPYSVTLVSKLMFGWAAAMTLHALSGAQTHKRMGQNSRSQILTIRARSVLGEHGLDELIDKHIGQSPRCREISPH